MLNTFSETYTSQEVLFGEVGKLQTFFQVIVLIQTSEHTLVAPVVNKHSMIFTSYSPQISVKLNRPWKI